jgi:hypothetical protein
MKLSICFNDLTDFVIPELFQDKEVDELQVFDYSSKRSDYYVKVYYYPFIKRLTIFRQDMESLKYDTSLDADLNSKSFICAIIYHYKELKNA